MRRFTALAATALTLSLSLTACSSDSDNGSDSAKGSDEKLTLALIPNEKVNDPGDHREAADRLPL